MLILSLKQNYWKYVNGQISLKMIIRYCTVLYSLHLSDTHNTTSWLDHIICSHDLQRNLESMDILDRIPSSEHLQ